MIRAITFDLWNTLLVEKSYIERRLSILSEALKAEGQNIPLDALESAYSTAQRRHNELWSKEHRHYPLAERLDNILKDASVSLSSELKMGVIDKFESAVLNDQPPLTHCAAETVIKLSKRFRLGVISDTGVTSGSKIRELLDRKGILGFFTVAVFSDETGVCKPRWEAFDAALRGLGVQPGEALHVGDSLRTDVAGAKASGMKGVWLSVREPDADGISPDYTITRLDELLKIPEISDVA